MQGFEIKAHMKPPRFKVDKSSTVAFDTGELNVQEKMLILENDGALGTVVFVPEEQESTPPKIDSEIETKSLSERLRNVMFVFWSQQGEPEGNFNVWRAKEMERIIQAYKDKLE